MREINVAKGYTSTCECADPGCPAAGHVIEPCDLRGVTQRIACCNGKTSRLLFRVDMQDLTGTLFCEGCAEDALESGLFTTSMLRD